MRPRLFPAFVLALVAVATVHSGCKSKSAEQAAPADEPSSAAAESAGGVESAGAAESVPAESSGEAPGDSDYRTDFDNICHSESRSKADEQDGPRHVTIALWLGSTIKTDQARDFLATLSRTPPAEKAALLESERLRLGLEACPLVQTWRG